MQLVNLYQRKANPAFPLVDTQHYFVNLNSPLPPGLWALCAPLTSPASITAAPQLPES